MLVTANSSASTSQISTCYSTLLFQLGTGLDLLNYGFRFGSFFQSQNIKKCEQNSRSTSLLVFIELAPGLRLRLFERRKRESCSKSCNRSSSDVGKKFALFQNYGYN